jgi:FeS assembly protein IscX
MIGAVVRQGIPEVTSESVDNYAPDQLVVIDEITPALYWDSPYAIAMALIDAFPEYNPEKVGLHQLSELIAKLPGFTDDLELANERILVDIQIVWYEEFTNE